MCTTQRMTIPDGHGGTVVVTDTQDCRRETCPDSVYYKPK